MSSEKLQILHQLRSLLNYHEALELGGYPGSKELTQFLNCRRLPGKSQVGAVEGQSGEPVAEVLPKSTPLALHDTINEIAEEVRGCRSCDLYRDRIVPVPGTGGHKARLLVIGGWLTTSSSNHIEESCVFGNDEDQMLLKMLDAIHLSQKATFVTNVIKCGITPSVQPKKENVEICLPYLHRQIAATLPDVICSMGLIATHALLQSSKPLSQLRGRFHEYRLDEQKNIAVMPTYHPSFLLKNPEMKKATWNDLQLIEKRLNRK